MTTINLYQKEQENNALSRYGKMKSNIIFFLTIFGMILVAFVAIKMITLDIANKKNLTEAKIVTEKEALNGNKKVDEVIDSQFRLKEIKNNLSAKIEMNDVLDKVSSLVIPGVNFLSYKYADKKILITLRAINFSNISKQISNFKNADFVVNVNATNFTRSEDGVTCEVAMNMK